MEVTGSQRDIFDTDEAFLAYVDLHSKTERALFHINHIARLYCLAGEDAYLVGLPKSGFFSMFHDEAEPLLKKAWERRRKMT